MKILIALLLSAAVYPQEVHQHRRPAGQYARSLEDPRRDAWQKPEEVVAALAIKPNEIVADIGAGTGYFTRRLAAAASKVYAVDIDEQLLKMAAANSPANVETVLAAADDPRLPDASVDTLFFCNVLHHIEGRAAYYARLDKALKPGGRIVLLEWYKRPLPVGPRQEMKLSEEEVTAELEAAGFVRTASFDFLPYQYFFVFQRR